jgi:hypothetical protein
MHYPHIIIVHSNNPPSIRPADAAVLHAGYPPSFHGPAAAADPISPKILLSGQNQTNQADI